MKKMKNLMFFLVAVVIFASCNKEYAEPTVTWDGEATKVIDFSVADDNVLTFDVTIKAEAGIDNFILWKFAKENENILSSESLEIGEDWKGLEEYTYSFNQTIAESEFDGGVNTIEFEFEVKDTEGQVTSVFYTITKNEAYTITFVITDGVGNNVEDAVVTFNEVTNEAGDYVFSYIAPGEYNYTITKEGFVDETGTTTVSETANIELILKQTLTSFDDNIILSNQSYATYNGAPRTGEEDLNIGVKYSSANAGVINIEKTDNCEGWVVIDDVTAIEFYHNLATIYENGEVVENLAITVPDVGFKSFTEMYFVSKVDGKFVMVHNTDGVRHADNGNVVVFTYKTIE